MAANEIINWGNIAAGAVGGILVAVIGHFLTKQRDAFRDKNARAQNAKYVFLVFISTQRYSVDRRNYCGWHSESRPKFRDAVAAVCPFLNDDQRASIDTAWREYDALNSEQLNQENEADYVQEIDAIAKEPRTPKPSEILNDYFDRFEEAAK
jgi:hypothetical protein